MMTFRNTRREAQNNEISRETHEYNFAFYSCVNGCSYGYCVLLSGYYAFHSQ